jgi:hypothetical protein
MGRLKGAAAVVAWLHRDGAVVAVHSPAAMRLFRRVLFL